MPGYNFQKQFCPRVESGEKTHTVRGKRKQQPKPGQMAALYYGLRSKQTRLLGRSTIVKVEDVKITFDKWKAGKDTFGFIVIEINGQVLCSDEVQAFAKRDGFEKGSQGMLDFWAKNHTSPFHGDIIHWAFPFVWTAPAKKKRGRRG